MARHRLDYGRRHGQHGDLWVPDRAGVAAAPRWPVVVLLHGGFWRAMYTMSLMTELAADIMDRGWVAWNLEYRRCGTFPPGGWPGTFEDVGAGIDHLTAMAEEHRLDLDRVVTVGHSAGGHLALWAAGRCNLPPGAPGAPGAPVAPSASAAPGSPDHGAALAASAAVGAAGSADPGALGAPLPPGAGAGRGRVRLRGAVGLAPVSDLAEAARMGLGGGAVQRLLGGGPERHPERYAVANPAQLLPFGVPQVLVHGDNDGAVPIALSRSYVARASEAGDQATLVELPGGGHMELIDPASTAWSATVLHMRPLLT